jgi:hypothetical protein
MNEIGTTSFPDMIGEKREKKSRSKATDDGDRVYGWRTYVCEWVSERGKRDEKGRGPKAKENVDRFRGSYDPGVSQCIDVW